MRGFDCHHLVYLLLTIPFLFWSCNRPPVSDYYEADGIISIETTTANQTDNWIADSTGVAHSIVSRQLDTTTAGETDFTFYIRTPGQYAFWLLGNTSREHSQPLQLRFLNEQDETISFHRLEIISEEIPRWVNIDQIIEEPVVLEVEEEGFYSVQLESGGMGGLHVSKLHFSKDGTVIPTGSGYPETIDWRMEPVIDKRLEQARIPPSWVFGLIVNQHRFITDGLVIDMYYGGGNLMLPDTKIGRHMNTELKKIDFKFFTDLESFDRSASDASHSRLFDLYPLHDILHATHKNFPVPWYRPKNSTGFEALRETIGLLSNPDLVTYESPWLLILPEWYDPQNPLEDELSEELLIRTLQLATFQNIMFVPFQSIDQAEKHREYFRQLIDFRRQLFPYIYSYTNRARTIGTKLITGDRNHPDQFLFGDYFLVAPVYEEGAVNRELNLPSGNWYHYESEEFFEGGQRVEVNATRYSIPLFVKAGAVIPRRTDGTLPIKMEDNDELILDVYGGDSGTFRLYEDDGESLGYLSGEFSTIAYRYFEGDGYSTFNIGAQVNNFPGRRDQTEYTIRFKFLDRPTQIIANGNTLSQEDWLYREDQRLLILNWTQIDRERTEFRIEF